MSAQRFHIVLAGACCWMALGCATIIHGSSQDINISTSPDGAEAWVNGARLGTTPTRLTLKRHTDHTIHLVKEGYKAVDVQVESSLSAWLIGNVVFGGIPGCIVDLITGGAYELSPQRLDVNMTKVAMLDAPIVVPFSVAQSFHEIHLYDDNHKEIASFVIDWE